MINIIDFSNCQLSPRNLEYGGRAGEKRGIIYKNEFRFLKFPKTTINMENVKGLSYVTSPINEFIGSNIFRILGFNAHETLLGVCFDGKKLKVVCACKDFIKDDKNELLIPYTSLRNDTSLEIMEKRDTSYFSASNINEIIFQLDHNTILSTIPLVKEKFWNMVIIDALINNNDRNEDNRGVIKHKNEKTYEFAPIYDCGNCFYGKTSEERIIKIMSDNTRLLNSALNCITAFEDDDAKQITIKELFALNNLDLKISLQKIHSIVKQRLDEIISFINSIPTYYKDILIMSDQRKAYYIATLKIRVEKLLNDKVN